MSLPGDPAFGRDAPSRRQWLVSVAGSLLAGQCSLAQEQPTFSTEVKVVNVFSTVREKNGQLVRGLNKQDFALLENGRLQTIRYFSQDSDLPLTIGLLIDTSLSQGRVLEDERGASYRFLDQVLRENKDQAAIVQFDQAIVIRQGLTRSHKDLQDTLSLLDTPTAEQARGGSGTLLYDAVRTASIKIMRDQQGRKAFIVLTDGVDFGSEVSLTDAIEAAQRAGTLVYCILFSDESYYGGHFSLGPNGKGVLKHLSSETGGGYFEVSKERGIEEIYKAIEEELRSQYSLGFVSDQPVEVPGFRKLSLKTNRKGLIVQATDRYYAEP
jgi:VWFA-related protein